MNKCKSEISCLRWKFSFLKSGLILKFLIPGSNSQFLDLQSDLVLTALWSKSASRLKILRHLPPSTTTILQSLNITTRPVIYNCLVFASILNFIDALLRSLILKQTRKAWEEPQQAFLMNTQNICFSADNVCCERCLKCLPTTYINPQK